MSIWEYKRARERMKQIGDTKADENRVLSAITELRALVESSKEKTKKARRLAQRQREHEKNISPAKPLVNEPRPQMQIRLPIVLICLLVTLKIMEILLNEL